MKLIIESSSIWRLLTGFILEPVRFNIINSDLKESTERILVKFEHKTAP